MHIYAICHRIHAYVSACFHLLFYDDNNDDDNYNNNDNNYAVAADDGHDDGDDNDGHNTDTSTNNNGLNMFTYFAKILSDATEAASHSMKWVEWHRYPAVFVAVSI